MPPPTRLARDTVESVLNNRAPASPRGPLPPEKHRVAVVCWNPTDELAEALSASLEELGHSTVLFDSTARIPDSVDIVFSFAPYGNFMAIVDRLAAMPAGRRPLLIHWNTEGIPDPHLPWSLVYPTSRARSWIGHFSTRKGVENAPPFAWFKHRMLRYRYVGDYYSAYRSGILSIFADSSTIYAGIHRKHGLPTTYFPWGSTPGWYGDLNLPRDIDVLWLGKRGSQRRSQLIDQVRGELRPHGVRFHVVDNVENPYVFGRDRLIMLNRAKITLNITRTWFDDNFSRFSMAVPNRSLIVSEPMLPHCPEYKAGVHYVSAQIQDLGATILRYLQAEEERCRVVDNAYRLLTEDLTLTNSVAKVMRQADALLQRGHPQTGSNGA